MYVTQAFFNRLYNKVVKNKIQSYTSSITKDENKVVLALIEFAKKLPPQICYLLLVSRYGIFTYSEDKNIFRDILKLPPLTWRIKGLDDTTWWHITRYLTFEDITRIFNNPLPSDTFNRAGTAKSHSKIGHIPKRQKLGM